MRNRYFLVRNRYSCYKRLEVGEEEPMAELWFEDELVLFDVQDDQEWTIINWDANQTRGNRVIEW